MKRPATPERDEFSGTYSLAQLARRWGLRAQDVRRMLGRQELGFIQIRGAFRVPHQEVERYERRREA